MNKKNVSKLVDFNVHVKFKLFALWSSVMFFYIYGDYFELYQPGKLQDMLRGSTVFGVVSQQHLLGLSAIMIVPSLMPFLSLALPASVNRWTNILVGTLYTFIVILAVQGGWRFYVVFGTIEIMLTLLVVWFAWAWQREAIS